MGNFNYTISIGQLGEQLTLNQWVLGSSPRWCTTKYLARGCGVFFYCMFLRELLFPCTSGDENSLLRRLPPPAAVTASP